MERSEAEAIYDGGREACVEVLIKLSARVEQLERRVERLERGVSPRRGPATSSGGPITNPQLPLERSRVVP